jgi:sugar-specific transcriptional regulator TrmB
MVQEMTTQDVTRTLMELGLTEIQTKVLLSLCRFDKATARDIAKDSGIHRQEVYPILNGLHILGLVERDIGAPNQYRTMPLGATLNALLERKITWMNELHKNTSELSKKLSTYNGPKKRDEEYYFKVITGRERLSKALINWQENARTWDFAVRYTQYGQQMNERLKTNRVTYREDIKIRIITSDKPKNHRPVSLGIKM